MRTTPRRLHVKHHGIEASSIPCADTQLTLAIALTLAVAPLPAQQQTPRRTTGGDSSTVTAVVVDLVVRDRKGLPVTDLTAADFEVTEDDVRAGHWLVPAADGRCARVGRHRRSGATAAAAAAGRSAPAASPAPPRPAATGASRGATSVVALVFDRLSPDSRRFTKLAAERYIGKGAESEHVVGIFATDWGLEVVQGFTRETAVLRAALDKVATRTGSLASDMRADARSDMERASQIENTMSAIGTGTPAAGAAQGAAGADLQMAQMQQRMSETYSMLERDQQGYGTMNAMTSVVNALKLVPGRKSVLFFSEGLVIPPNVMPRFLSLIDEANRANVAVYAMDAKGLRAESTQAEARDEINAYAAGRLEQRRAQHRRRRRGVALSRTQRRHAAHGSLVWPRAARQRDGRLPDRWQQQLRQGLRPRVRGHPVALRADVLVEQARLRRQVPHDRRQGEAPRAHGVAPQGVLRGAAQQPTGLRCWPTRRQAWRCSSRRRCPTGFR